MAALKQMIITRKIADLDKEKKELLIKRSALTERRKALTKREEIAVQALLEINEDSTGEERHAIEAESISIDTEDAAITVEEKTIENRLSEVEREIMELKLRLDEINKKIEAPVVEIPGDEPDIITYSKREGKKTMKFADGFTERKREIKGLCTRSDVKDFLTRARTLYRGGVNGATLTIPTVMLPMLRDAIGRNTKLMKHVNKMSIKGDARQNILAAAPEAVWTDTIGKINELDLTINQVKVDGHKVGGFIQIPNPYLEDSDENLAGIIIDQIGQSIGYALDKAILFGTGSNMPIGIMTRLAATAKPAWWQNNMPDFTALNTSHIGKQSAASVKDSALIQEMLSVLGKAKNQYGTGNGDLFWAMSSATWTKLKIMTMNFNSAGAIVAGINDELPIIGGAVETLDFLPDDVVIGGYGSHYLLAERAGINLAESKEYKFLDDVTVYKGTARYDGIPVLGKAFAAFSLSQTAVPTTMTFASDKANASDADDAE